MSFCVAGDSCGIAEWQLPQSSVRGIPAALPVSENSWQKTQAI
jgi:hypothetical protein